MKHVIIILFLLPIAVHTQSITDKSYSSWNSVILDYSISKTVYIKNETHFRRINFLKDWQQFLIRPSVHYKLNKQIDFSVGYTFAKNYRTFFTYNENDLWEQVQISHTSLKSKFKHRFRFEQRFIDLILHDTNANYFKEGIDFKMRFRYRFTWGVPLIKISGKKYLYLTAFDEIWLNTDSGIVPKSLNQNWFYSGLSYPIFKNTLLGFGYLNDYATVDEYNFRSNHILQTTIKYHFK